MELNWLQSLVYGVVSGITEILPVSAQAHRLLLRKVFGTASVSTFTLLMIHIAVLAAVYICCQSQILRILRAEKLRRLPKKRRKRPLDAISILDFRLLRTMALPMLLAFLFMHRVVAFENNIVVVASILIVNGVILYIPQFFPSGNKDARMLSRVDGLLIGLACAASALPGISAIGAAYSMASIRGADHTYAFNMSLLLQMLLLAALIIMDLLAIITEGMAGLSFLLILRSVFAAAIAFGGTILTVRFLRKLAVESSFTMFAYYCWGVALLSLMLTMFA